jgi:signal transduction histidine kinase
VSRDQLVVIVIAACWSLAVGAVCGLLSWRLRHASIRWSAGLIAVAAVAGVLAGVVGTAQAMFISFHDLQVVLLVCLVSGAVSLGFALWLARRLAAAARTLRDSAHRLGDGAAVAAEAVVGPREFHAVGTELARSSEQLRAAREAELRMEQSRRELVAWVSHDLRTPLAGLRAMAEALDDGLAEDPSRYHRRMLAEVDRMVLMVDDLFELSRIHAGALSLSLQAVPLGDVVSETIAGTGPVARARRVTVGGSVDSDAVVRADPGALSRVVANLVMNAIRHTPADGTVRILGRRDGEVVELSVTDACGGIDAADLERVFDVAWQADHARTPGALAGAGLGLAIVKGLVEAHDGTVAVANHASGCRFTVRLPA